jgi:hypothetical protein
MYNNPLNMTTKGKIPVDAFTLNITTSDFYNNTEFTLEQWNLLPETVVDV